MSYCRTLSYCADGGIDFVSGDYPSVVLPITLTFEEPIGYITAHATAPDRDDVPVEMTGVDPDGRPLNDAVTIERLVDESGSLARVASEGSRWPCTGLDTRGNGA